MDSNVSKNTNSHKFFKISLEPANLTISLRNLVKQWLLLIYDLYHQKFQEPTDYNFITAAIVQKIILVNFQLTGLNLNGSDSKLWSQSELIPITYGCPLGLLLASYGQLPLSSVIKNIKVLLQEVQNHFTGKSEFKLSLSVTNSGWLNIFIDAQVIALWLEKLSGQINCPSSSSVLLNSAIAGSPNFSPLLPAQYIHARCCSLLNLGVREKLVMDINNLGQEKRKLQQSSSITWLDEKQDLWLTELSEYNLLRQLLMVTDSFAGKIDPDWSKIVLDLSQTTAIFLADCRFLGQVKHQSPQQAIARLGLIAIVQYWLQTILTDQLHLPAPTEL